MTLRRTTNTAWADNNSTASAAQSTGIQLRNARILAGYSLDEVAAALHIPVAHLDAIESGSFANLPPLVYAQGFVGAYAAYLHLDRNDTIERFKAEVEGREHAPQQPALDTLRNISDERHERRLPSAALIGVGFMLLVVVYGVFTATSPDRRDIVRDVPPLPARLEENLSAGTLTPDYTQQQSPITAPLSVSPTRTSPTSASSTPTVNTAAAATTMAQITIKAHGEGWIQVLDAAGNRLESLVMNAGEIYQLPKGSHNGLSVLTGDISLLEFQVDGKTVAVTSPTRKSQYRVQLDANALAAGTALID
jgi:cytoskeleton protein RodZ